MIRTAFVFFLLFSSFARADIHQKFLVDQWSLDISSSYFNTSSNFDTGSQFERLPNGHSYSNWENTIGFRYDVATNFALRGFTVLSYATSEDEDFNRDRFDLTYLGFQGLIDMPTSLFRFIPEFQVKFPLKQIEFTTDDVLNSDGAIHLFAGANLLSHFVFVDTHFRAGLDYRTQGFSSLAVFEANVRKKLGSFIPGGGIGGYYTALKDQYTDEPKRRRNVTDRVNGGSYQFFEINPNSLHYDLNLGIDWSKEFNMLVGYRNTFNGDSSARGYTLYLSMEFSPTPGFDDTEVDYSDRRELKKKRQEETNSLKNFQYEEETDAQKFFEEQKDTRKKLKRKKRKQTQKMLNDTEKMLENQVKETD